MNQPFQVIVTFNRVGDAKFSAQGELIVTALTTEPLLTFLPDPIPHTFPSRAALRQALADYRDAARRAKDSKSAVHERNEKRDVLEQLLTDFAPLLEVTAKAANDISILMKSGYALRRPSVKGRYAIPAAPHITVKRGPVSGTILLRVNPLLPGRVSYEPQFAVGSVQENPQFQRGVTSTTGSRILVTDLAVAQWHQFRVRGWGAEGPGDWSNVVPFVVT